MSAQEELKQFYKLILSKHQNHWDSRRDILQDYMNLYTSQFYNESKDQVDIKGNGIRKVETPYSFNSIESYVNQLFLVDPAVVVEADPMSQNDPTPIETLCNRWLTSHYKTFENATRLGLIYDMAYVKVYGDAKRFKPETPSSILSSVRMCALKPWEVITDLEAESFENQRFAGHTYQITLAEAKAKYGDKEYLPNSKDFFFKEDFGDFTGSTAANSTNAPLVPDKYRYIRIVEVYDLIEDQLVIWTPDHKNGFYVLKKTKLPIRNSDDEPMLPIIPIIFAWRPDNPLVGLSTMGRGYSSYKELNDLRTYMANAVRTQKRVYIANKERFTESMAKQMMSGPDGVIILAEPPADQGSFNVGDYIQEVPIADVSSDFSAYEQSILRDIAQSTLLGPNSRGEVTRASATEVSYISQYAASDSAKMARQKAETVQLAAETYIRTLVSLMAEEDNFSLVIEQQTGEKAGSVTIGKKDLEGKFQYVSVDQANSPITKAMKKQQFLQVLPILLQSGADTNVLREEIVSLFELPPSLAKAPAPAKEDLALPTDLKPEPAQEIPPAAELEGLV